MHARACSHMQARSPSMRTRMDNNHVDTRGRITRQRLCSRCDIHANFCQVETGGGWWVSLGAKVRTCVLAACAGGNTNAPSCLSVDAEAASMRARAEAREKHEREREEEIRKAALRNAQREAEVDHAAQRALLLAAMKGPFGV
eukprot:4592117-Prymnesium_polylepis.1